MTEKKSEKRQSRKFFFLDEEKVQDVLVEVGGCISFEGTEAEAKEFLGKSIAAGDVTKKVGIYRAGPTGGRQTVTTTKVVWG